MSVKRVVDTSFWSDDKVIDNFSPEDKLFMLYLLTNPHTTQLGVYTLSRKQAAFEIGWSVETIGTLLDRFERVYKIIKCSPETNEIAIVNFLRYSIIAGGKPVADLLQKEIMQVKDKSLLVYVAKRVLQFKNINATVKEVCEKILLKEKESTKEKEENQNQNQNQNDNDNDNDKSYPKSYHDSYNDSYHDSSEAPIIGIQKELHSKTNTHDSHNDSSTTRTTIRKDTNFSSQAKDIIDYLNAKLDTKYKTDNKKTLELIKARLKEGFTVEDFKTVIDKKSFEWGNDSNMCQYLRPVTLFSTKFESYLNQPFTKHMTASEKNVYEIANHEFQGNYFDD